MLRSVLIKIEQNKHLHRWSFGILACIVLTYRITIALNQTPELLNGETNNIWNALKVISGNPIYTNPEAIPYEIFQYTPLSQFPIILFAWIEAHFFHSKDFIFTLSAGRFLSIFYNLLSAFAIFKLLTNHLKVNSQLAMFGALTFLCLLPHHFFAIRPDSMALLFIVSGIYFFTKAYFFEHNKYYIYSALILAAAFFVKQDAFLISGAFGLILLSTKNFKGLLTFSLTLILSLGVLLSIAPFLFGPYFYKSIFGGVALSLKADQFVAVLVRYATFYYLYLLIFLLCLYYFFRVKGISKKHIYFFAILLFLTFFIAAFTSLKVGSHFNYYVLPNLIVLLFICVCLNLPFDSKKYRFTFITTALVAYGISTHFLFFQYFHYTSPFLKYTVAKKERVSFIDENREIFEEINSSNYNVCSYDNRAKINLADKIILPNSEFYGISKFSYSDFDNADSKKRIDVIVLPLNYNLHETDLGRFVGNLDTYTIWKQTKQLTFYKQLGN